MRRYQVDYSKLSVPQKDILLIEQEQSLSQILELINDFLVNLDPEDQPAFTNLDLEIFEDHIEDIVERSKFVVNAVLACADCAAPESLQKSKHQ